MEAGAGENGGFSIATIDEGTRLTVKVSGELDIATADQLSSQLDQLDVPQGGHVAVDLSQVGFMDSTGLRILIAANRKAGEAGYEFTVVTGESPARRVFELTRMDEHIRVVGELA